MRRVEGPGIAVIAVWLCVMLYLTPAIAVLWLAAPSWLEKLGLSVFIAMLNVFWFLGIYYVVVAIRSIGSRGLSIESSTGLDQPPVGDVKVLLLYPTRNDLRREAVEALRRVTGRCEVVICDDSTIERYISEIDVLAREVSGGGELNPVRVVRRPAGSAGWKAGNVNHALRQASADCDYFAICDADGIFPSDFVEKLLPHLHTFGGAGVAPIGFAQARQEANPHQADAFGRAMSVAVGAHFRHVVRGRQEGGFVMFYGHGALISMKAWHAVGGFPLRWAKCLASSA